MRAAESEHQFRILETVKIWWIKETLKNETYISLPSMYNNFWIVKACLPCLSVIPTPISGLMKCTLSLAWCIVVSQIHCWLLVVPISDSGQKTMLMKEKWVAPNSDPIIVNFHLNFSTEIAVKNTGTQARNISRFDKKRNIIFSAKVQSLPNHCFFRVVFALSLRGP